MSELLTPAIVALLGDLTNDKRARRAQKAITGRYGDILRGWLGQAELVRARLAREIIASRLNTRNGGEPLRELSDSECWAVLAEDPRPAVGEVILSRSRTTSTYNPVGVFQAGVIPAGARFTRPSNPAALLPTEEATYTSTEAVLCSENSTSVSGSDSAWVHTQTVTVPVQADFAGESANTPEIYGVPLSGELAGQLFDSGQPEAERFAVATLRASGGMLRITDDQVLAFAVAMAGGIDGPTEQSVVAGSLSNPGVRFVLTAQDESRAVLQSFCADASWAMSERFAAALLQELYDYPWIGFGCRVEAKRVINRPVNLRCPVVLRGKQYDSNRADITAAIREKLVSYFATRPDFHVWRESALGAIISQADRRILACPSVDVLDHGTSALLSEPAAQVPDNSPSVYRWFLAGDGLDISYSIG